MSFPWFGEDHPADLADVRHDWHKVVDGVLALNDACRMIRKSCLFDDALAIVSRIEAETIQLNQLLRDYGLGEYAFGDRGVRS